VITRPSDIEAGPDWNRRTWPEPSLESNMDFKEHQRIAFDALQLLAGNLAAANNAAGEKLKELKEAYEGGDVDDVLYISKGIHQPAANPHMQLQLERGKLSTSYTFHLNVSMSDVPGLPNKYFHWVGVQFTAEAKTIHGTVSACWPLIPAHENRNQNRRRMSIAPENVQSTIEAIVRATQEANRKEQARLAQSAKATTRNEIEKQLNSQNWTISGVKNTGLNKLIDGETIDVTTKKGNTIKVKFEGGKVKQSF
jgi:hypothetical protein